MRSWCWTSGSGNAFISKAKRLRGAGAGRRPHLPPHPRVQSLNHQRWPFQDAKKDDVSRARFLMMLPTRLVFNVHRG